MLTIRLVQKLLSDLADKHRCPDKPAYLAIPISPGTANAEVYLRDLRELGYHAMLRTTAFGDEIVVTDLVQHGDAGPARCETS